jgi:hypothetical protein
MRTHRVIAFIALSLLAVSVVAVSISNPNKEASASTPSTRKASLVHSRLSQAAWAGSASLIDLARGTLAAVRNPPVVSPVQSAFLVALDSDDSLAMIKATNAIDWYNTLQAEAAAFYAGILASESAPAPAPPPAEHSSGGSGGSASSGGGSAGGGGDAGGKWAAIRACESGGNYSEDTGNGFYGAYQFSMSTWQSLGYSGNPADASPATQDAAAQKLEAESGWGNWPVCGSR